VVTDSENELLCHNSKLSEGDTRSTEGSLGDYSAV